MSSKRFSVVIPTRDRERTLPATLQTCLAQEFEDFEIVVSDNSTTDATRSLIERIDSPKIKYVRPPRPLAMSANWDFAVDHASGEFVTVIGSDDGLLLHALPEADRIIRMLSTNILRWDPVCYNWPDFPNQEGSHANDLLIPTKQTDWYFPIHLRDSHTAMQAAAHSEISYAELPMIYCSFVHRSLIQKLKRLTQRMFLSECPDIYSGFALAHLVGNYPSLDAPMTINGLSGPSNGVASIMLKEQSPVTRDFKSLNKQDDLIPVEEAPALPVIPSFVADSFLHAKRALFPDDKALTLDRRRVIMASLRDLRAQDDTEWDLALKAVKASVQDDVDLQVWFETNLASVRRQGFEFSPHYHLKRYGQTYLCLDAAEFGVADVFQAAQLCEKILGFKRDGVNAHVKPAASP